MHPKFTVVANLPESQINYIFIYGSLLNARSIRRTLSKEDCDLVCIPAKLNSYKLKWGAPRNVNKYVDKSGRQIEVNTKWLSLVAVKGIQNDHINGAVIGVTDRGLIALKNRERSYTLVNVRDDVEACVPDTNLLNQPIKAFIANESIIKLNDQQYYIRKEYYNSIIFGLLQFHYKKYGKYRHIMRIIGRLFPRIILGLKKPQNAKLYQAYFANEVIEDRLNSKAALYQLKLSHKSIIAGLQASKENRERKWALSPLCFSSGQYNDIAKCAEKSVALSVKALQVISRNESLIADSGWSHEDVKLLDCAIQNDDQFPVIARVDLTYSGNRLMVLEINADSPGGMHHYDILVKEHMKMMRNTHAPNVSFGDVEVCTTIYNEMIRKFNNQKGGYPERAVLVERDPQYWATYPEMLYFVEMFNDNGILTHLVNLKNEKFKNCNGRLCGEDNLPIDLVYKRILWSDMNEEFSESAQALNDAYLKQSICIVNSPGSRMAGSKLIFSILKSQNVIDIFAACNLKLNNDEINLINNNIPETFYWGDAPSPLCCLGSSKIRKICNEAYKYVLKSFHGYGGKDVVIGAFAEKSYDSFYNRLDKGYIIQEFLPHNLVRIATWNDGEVSWDNKYFILGAYVVNGKCIGIEAKVSHELPINMNTGGARTSVFYI